MQYLRNKFNPTSVKRKMITGFFLALIAIALAFGVTHFSFQQMLETVDQLSDPNRKLMVLNTVFEEVTKLDQLQRSEAIRSPHKPYKVFLNQSQAVTANIDSLLTMPWDSAQFTRLA